MHCPECGKKVKKSKKKCPKCGALLKAESKGEDMAASEPAPEYDASCASDLAPEYGASLEGEPAPACEASLESEPSFVCDPSLEGDPVSVCDPSLENEPALQDDLPALEESEAMAPSMSVNSLPDEPPTDSPRSPAQEAKVFAESEGASQGETPAHEQPLGSSEGPSPKIEEAKTFNIAAPGGVQDAAISPKSDEGFSAVETTGANIPVSGTPGEAFAQVVKENPKIADVVANDERPRRRPTKRSYKVLVGVIVAIALVIVAVAFALSRTGSHVDYPNLLSMVSDDGSQVAASLESCYSQSVDGVTVFLSSESRADELVDAYRQGDFYDASGLDGLLAPSLDGQWLMTLSNYDLGYMTVDEAANGTDVDQVEFVAFVQDSDYSCQELYDLLEVLGVSAGKVRIQKDSTGAVSGVVLEQDKGTTMNASSSDGMTCVKVAVFAWESESSYETAVSAFELGMENFDEGDYADSLVRQ